MKTVPQHLLLFASQAGYQIRVFAAAARRLGIDVTLATDRCGRLDDPWNDRAIAVKFDRIEKSLDALRDLRVDGVAAVGDRPAALAAPPAELFGPPLPPPPPAPARGSRACRGRAPPRPPRRRRGVIRRALPSPRQCPRLPR